jgi:hypothetical protein
MLLPAPSIAEYVEKVHATYFAHKVMVGVHVRQHDPDYDWSVVPPGRVLDDEEEDQGSRTEVEAGAKDGWREGGSEAVSSQQQQQQMGGGGDAPSAAQPFGQGAPPAMFRDTMLAIEDSFKRRYGRPSMSTPRLEKGVLEEVWTQRVHRLFLFPVTDPPTPILPPLRTLRVGRGGRLAHPFLRC